MNKPVSIKDLARLVGVSHSTVSRALRSSPVVNAETALLIQKVAQQQGYRVSLIGRSLVTRRSMTVGCVATDIADPFVGGVVNGIEEVANQEGYAVFLATSHADPKREVEVVRSFHERRVDGVIVPASRVGSLYLPLLAELSIPVVLINNQHPGSYTYSVSIDNGRAARLMTRHLLKLGHRRIAYIGHRAGGQVDTDRLDGYRSELRKSRLAFDPDLVLHADATPESGHAAMRRLIANGSATAVFCYDDMTALGALGAAYAAGVNVPGDISICGFDDLLLASYTSPPLTTIRQPMKEMGRRAAEILLALLQGKGSQRQVKFTGELIVRQSTAPPADRRRD
ncbi:MAG: LacI family DNA-binding transcriptional regulator [Bryobacteraceae bacterium]